MAVRTLTHSFLKEIFLGPFPEKSCLYFDTELKGFCLELRYSGNATYYFRYRDKSRSICLFKIGLANEIDLAAARAKAYQIRQLIKDGGDPKVEYQRFQDMPTFGRFIEERFLPFIKVSKRSAWMDETLLRKYLLPIFSEYRLNRIKRVDIIRMHHSAKSKGFADGTCNRWLALMRYIFNCAIRWEIIPIGSNPCDNVKLFEDNGAREKYLTKDELSRLLFVLDNTHHTQLAKIIKLLLFTGARKREILDAKWEDADLNSRLLRVPLSKSGKPRFIPLSDKAIEILKSIDRNKEVPWVFFNPNTSRPLVSTFYSWNLIRVAAGLPDLRIHDLRHSFASFLVNAGRSLYEVQRILGHYDPKVTMRYAHLSSEALIDAANVVGNITSSIHINSVNDLTNSI